MKLVLFLFDMGKNMIFMKILVPMNLLQYLDIQILMNIRQKA